MGTPMRTTPRNAIIFALLAGTWGQPHTRQLEDATTIAPTAYEACTYVPDACVFPFTYLGVEYQTCTDVGAGAAFWCSTTASYQFGASEDCAGCVPPSAAPSPPPSASAAPTAPGATAAPTATPAPSPAPTPRPTRRCATTTFSERVIYDQATYALHGFVADVDGDGDLDALSAAEGDGALCGTGVSEVAWYENDGAQSFAHRTVSDAREKARQVFAVDVDGDGDVDVLSASLYDDTIAWHENDGRQSFAERLISTLASAARTVYAADVDGDGDVDAVAGSGSDDTVEWFENDGSQSFSGSIITSRVLVPYDVKVLDVDGDADLDVMCASGFMDEGENDYVLNWFENDGFQSFTTREMSNQPLDAVTVYAADVDGDGDVDAVAALPGDDAVAWFENVGNYIFLQRIVVCCEEVDAWGVAAHDVDGDGDLDLLTAIYWDHKFASTTTSPRARRARARSPTTSRAFSARPWPRRSPVRRPSPAPRAGRAAAPMFCGASPRTTPGALGRRSASSRSGRCTGPRRRWTGAAPPSSRSSPTATTCARSETSRRTSSSRCSGSPRSPR